MAESATVSRGPRDPRLDFFRGIGMFIIFIAHMPGNFLTRWIPARFGFSDATEIFVFCSGMASGLAFAAIFVRHGWPTGTARIAHRVWQVYWAHIGVFLVIAAMLVVADASLGHDGRYVGGLNLKHFFNDPMANLVGLLTLTYVPNLFDILPMYLVILAMIPIVMALAQVSPWAVGAFVAWMWALATANILDLPAEPWSDRTWFFNPFAWQLVFFTGFAFTAGWLKAPPIDRRLVIAAIAVVVVTIPVAYFRIYRQVEILGDVREFIGPLINKSHFGIFRYVHFLALAYLAYVAAGEGGRRLYGGTQWTTFVAVVRKVGQQSLAVFLASLVLARIGGIYIKETGASKPEVAVVTLLGCLVLVAVAYTVSWLKSQPWRKTPVRPAPTGLSDTAVPVVAADARRA